jgi:titin
MRPESTSIAHLTGRRRRRCYRPRIEVAEPRQLLATFAVNTTADDTNADATLSLREAIEASDGTLQRELSAQEQAQVSGAVGDSNTIDFDIPTTDPGYDATTGVWTIQVHSQLPSITRPVLIDGTQPGFSRSPIIVLDGSGIGPSSDGLLITSPTPGSGGGSGSAVQGLVIVGFKGAGIRIDGTSQNTITGNSIGTATSPNQIGVRIQNRASGNIIGGTTESARNTISGNANAGIEIYGGGTTHNVVEGNYIGVDANGTKPVGIDVTGEQSLSYQGDGVLIDSGASDNTVGGTADGAGNTISGNSDAGVKISGGDTNCNTVSGNDIGLDRTGAYLVLDDQNLETQAEGVLIDGAAAHNTVGGITSAARNIISGNIDAGVRLAGVNSNSVMGNYLGTDVWGAQAIIYNEIVKGRRYINPAQSEGVEIDTGASNNCIGGTTNGASNVISGNELGLLITGFFTSGNIVERNFIGPDPTGMKGMLYTGTTGKIDPAQGEGVDIEDSATSNIIGGTTPAARNIITGNSDDGVLIDGCNSNVVEGNYIGTNAKGDDILTSPSGMFISNQYGVEIRDAFGNSIGGDLGSAGNVISGNATAGVVISGQPPPYMQTGNLVAGNLIGLEANGLDSPNSLFQLTGILVDRSPSNTIGGSIDSAMANVIAGNDVGIKLNGFASVIRPDGTTVVGLFTTVTNNYIGITQGNDPVGNGFGIQVNDSSGNTIGGTGNDARNFISYNMVGISIFGLNAKGNVIQGNDIGVGTDRRLLPPMSPYRGTVQTGVFIENASKNRVEGNFISGNAVGVYIFGKNGSASDNLLKKNKIGTKVGRGHLGNRLYGILLYNAPNNPRVADKIGRSGIATFREFTGNAPPVM